jgi:hypothetical protein
MAAVLAIAGRLVSDRALARHVTVKVF